VRQILDAMEAVAGIHRKAAIRLLPRAPGMRGRAGRLGRPVRYGPGVAGAAAVLSRAAGQIGAHRLHPFVLAAQKTQRLRRL
jgi:hypothetical protein